MANTLISSGYGSILAYLTGKTSLASTVNNIVECNKSSNDIESCIKVGISAAQTSASVWEMIGKELYTIKFAGKSVPLMAGMLSASGLYYDLNGMLQSYQKDGTIKNSDIYSALGNIASFASTVALMGAAAASSPFLIATATVLTVAGGVLTLASMASKDSSIELAGILNGVLDSLAILICGLVWNCCFPFLKSKRY